MSSERTKVSTVRTTWPAARTSFPCDHILASASYTTFTCERKLSGSHPTDKLVTIERRKTIPERFDLW